MSTFEEFAVRASAGAPPLDQMHKNALSKQYNISVSVIVTEAVGDKPFWNTAMGWPGSNYGFLVAIQHELKEVVDKALKLGGVVATGEMPPLPPPTK
jgi:hypothetical protein